MCSFISYAKQCGVLYVCIEFARLYSDFATPSLSTPPPHKTATSGAWAFYLFPALPNRSLCCLCTIMFGITLLHELRPIFLTYHFLCARVCRTRKFFIPPTEWAPPGAYPFCFGCDIELGHEFFCRLCGEMFCKDCTHKMDNVPAEYKKKGKPGEYILVILFRMFS